MRASFFPIAIFLFFITAGTASAEVPTWKWIEWEMLDVLVEFPDNQAARGILDSSDATTATLKLADGTLHKVEMAQAVELYRLDQHFGSYETWKNTRKGSWVLLLSGLGVIALQPITECATGGCVTGPVMAIGGGALLWIGKSKMNKATYIENLLKNAKTTSSSPAVNP